MDSEPDDRPRSAGGSPEDDGRSDGAGQADGTRPGLVGVLWCVVVIVAVLVIGVAMGMLDGR
jgi:hypothetical protein